MDAERLTADIEKALSKSGITLIKTSSTDYQEVNLALLENLIERRKMPGVYITVNKPYTVIGKMLKDRGIDTSRVFFIDAISKNLNEDIADKQDNVVFADSPQDLTDLSIMMDQVVMGMKEKEKFVFFDSMSLLSMYNDSRTVEKFAHRFSNRMRDWKVAGMMMSVEDKLDSTLVSHLEQFADHVIEI